MFQLKLSYEKLKKLYRKGTLDRPDFIIYDFNQNQYNDFWKFITTSKSYLYTDGLNVINVGWFRKVFETVKGWFGFRNYCHASSIKLTVAKIAYAGYLKGWQISDQDNLSTLVSSEIMDLVRAPKSNENIATFQQLLTSYFKALNENSSLDYEDYYFGQVFAEEKLYSLLPNVEPQNDVLINDVIKLLGKNVLADPQTNQSATKFGEIYAKALVEKYKSGDYVPLILNSALKWNPKIDIENTSIYLKFYFSQKDLLNTAKIINEMFSTSSNPNEAVQFVKKYFSHDEQIYYLTRYPELTTKLALSYLADAFVEYSKSSLMKLWRDDMYDLLLHAHLLAPTVFQQTNSIYKETLEKIWASFKFNIAIKDGLFSDADTIFLNNPNCEFDADSLKKLENHYLEQYNLNGSLIEKNLSSVNAEATENLGFKQIDLNIKLARINSKYEKLPESASLNYASILLRIIQKGNLDPLTASTEQVQKAQCYLDRFFIFVKYKFNYAEQHRKLADYPQLREKLALSYLEDAFAEFNKSPMLKLLSNNIIPLLVHADKLNPLALQHTNSIYKETLEKVWAIHKFKQAIKEKHFSDAEALYLQFTNYQFDPKDLKELENNYLAQYNFNNPTIEKNLTHHNVEAAEKLSLEQIGITTKLTQLNSEHNKLLESASSNYASVLLKIDQKINLHPKNADMEKLDKAQCYLNGFFNKNPKTLNELLLRKIDYRISLIENHVDNYYSEYIKLFPKDPSNNYNWKYIRQFTIKYQTEINALKKDLADFISLNPAPHTPEMRTALARVNYLLADTLFYFEEKTAESIPYFLNATKLIPENPYYRAKYYDAIEDSDKKTKAFEDIEEVSKGNLTNYCNYLRERWNNNKVVSNGFDIHTPIKSTTPPLLDSIKSYLWPGNA